MKAICIKGYENVKQGTIVNIQDSDSIYYKGEFVCLCESSVFENHFEIYNGSLKEKKKHQYSMRII
jgi:hypothetical protein